MLAVAGSMGFSVTEIMGMQYLVGVIVLGILFLILPRPKIKLKQVVQLLGVGATAAGTSFGYYNALTMLSSAAALTLLFQFVWMGVLLQIILERKLPDKYMVLAMVLVLVGTVFAAGMLEWDSSSLNPLGVFFGLLSAVFYTAFLHFSSRVATELPTTNRTFFSSIGSLLVTTIIFPGYLLDGAIFREFSWIGIPQALVGILLPVLLIQKGAPKLPRGVTTIMASSELPSGIVMGALFIGDKVSLPEIAGIVLILAGIVVSQADVFKERWIKPQISGDKGG